MIWLLSITFAYCLGIIFSYIFVQYDLLWLGFFILPLLCLLILKSKKQAYFYGIAILPFIFLISIYWTEFRMPKPLSNDISYQATKKEIIVEGTIKNEPTVKEDSVS